MICNMNFIVKGGFDITKRGFNNNIALHAGTPKPKEKFSEHQISVLEASFRFNFYPSKSTLKKLALQTGVDENCVKQWFKRKRHISRKGKGDEHNYF